MTETAFPLVTERLLLRPWADADKPAFRRMNADPRVMAFFPAPLSDGQSDVLLDRIRAHQAEHGFTFWAVEDRADGQLAGMTGLARVTFTAPFTPCVEIGWGASSPLTGARATPSKPPAVRSRAPSPRCISKKSSPSPPRETSPRKGLCAASA